MISNVAPPWTPTSALILYLTNWGGNGGPATVDDVLFHVIGFSVDRPGLDEVEAAVGALVRADLMSASATEFALTATGNELLKRVRRVREEPKRLARLLEELATIPLADGQFSWGFDEVEWGSLLRRHTIAARDRLTARKSVVDGRVLAIDRLDEINAVVRSAPDRRAAVSLLAEPPFAFSEMQAHHILVQCLVINPTLP